MGSKKRKLKCKTLLVDENTLPEVETNTTGIDMGKLCHFLQTNSNVIANNKRATNLISNVKNITTKGGLNYKMKLPTED